MCDKKNEIKKLRVRNSRERVNVHLNYVHTPTDLQHFSRVDFCVFQYRISLSSSSQLVQSVKKFEGEHSCGVGNFSHSRKIFSLKLIALILSFTVPFSHMINEKTFHAYYKKILLTHTMARQ